MLCVLIGFLGLPYVQGTQTPKKNSPSLQATNATAHAGISKEELRREARFNEILKGARQALRKKDFVKAIRLAQSAIDFAPQIQDQYQRNRATDDALDCLGKSYIGLREFKEAESVYQQRLGVERKYEKFDSSIAGNLQMLGMIEGVQGRWASAESFYLQSSKYLDDCIQHFKKSDDYDPQDIVANNIRLQKSELLFYLAVAYSHEGKFDDALKSCDEAYHLGKKFHAPPPSLGRIVEGAIGLIESSGQLSKLDAWRAREKALRSHIP